MHFNLAVRFIFIVCFVAGFSIIGNGAARASDPAANPGDAAAKKIPVILDCDIGDDIDDTWALVMLLRSPQLDVKLITSTCGKSEYRVKLIAKLLAVAKRTEIPIGHGAGGRDGDGGQQAWVKDFDLSKYPGKIHQDGVQAIIDAIENSSETNRVISIGPSHTLAAVLEKQPSIAKKAIFVGMQGSVRKGYNGSSAPQPEYNVQADAPAAQKALLAPWQQTIITPLDTCGVIDLSGEQFKSLRDSKDELVQALIENYRIWAGKTSTDQLEKSSILFDTVAIYLAYSGEKPLLEMETLSINVTPDGMTTIDPHGVKMQVATRWKDLEGFKKLLIGTLQGQELAPTKK
jgi:inosine-uridine nucleoside N-ribohydrolase